MSCAACLTCSLFPPSSPAEASGSGAWWVSLANPSHATCPPCAWHCTAAPPRESRRWQNQGREAGNSQACTWCKVGTHGTGCTCARCPGSRQVRVTYWRQMQRACSATSPSPSCRCSVFEGKKQRLSLLLLLISGSLKAKRQAGEAAAEPANGYTWRGRRGKFR